MDVKTRNLLADMLLAATEKFLEEPSSEVSADKLAARLNVSRSVVSKYLNEMASAHKAVKIITRPVLFLDKGLIEKKTGRKLSQEEFLSIQEFLDEIACDSAYSLALDNVIGSRSSLHGIVAELKASAQYPSPNGRAVLLLGEMGTGKKYLTNAYAFYLGGIEKKTSVLTVHCGRNRCHLKEYLFGGIESTGIIEKAENEIIYFHDAALLPQEVQEELALLIENGYMWRRNGKVVRCSARFVFGSDIADRQKLSGILERVIPVQAVLPPLRERTVREKELLLKKFFSEEQMKLGGILHISNIVYNILLRSDYQRNIAGLRDAVTSICARANVNRKDEEIRVLVQHLPTDLLSGVKDTVYDEARIFTLQELKEASEQDKVITLYNTILESYRENKGNSEPDKRENFFKAVTQCMNQCCDYIIFEKKLDGPGMEAIRAVIGNAFTAVQDKVNITARFRFIEVLAALTYKKMYLDSNIQTWEEEHAGELEEVLAYVQDEMDEEYRIASGRIDLLRQMLNLGSCSFDKLFTAINLRFYGSNPYRAKTAGLILAHGYATASSIADSVNRMLGTYIFDAVDMPLDVSASEVAEHVSDYIKCHVFSENLILLVDMGSLESITEKAGEGTNLQIGILNNVSTRCALDVGSGIMAYESLEDILVQACANNENKYRIITCDKRQDAILVITEAGEEATERIIRLLEKSLPKKIDVKFISANYHQIWAEGSKSPFFQIYHPLFIVCTMDTGIRDIPQLLLEDIIGIEDISYFRRLFGNYFNYSEMRQFTENLLKNFTLENVIENITILNPNILLAFVEDAVASLEIVQKIHIPPKTKITLYIHTCCMVERLITKSVPDLEREEKFEKTSGDFIDSFEKSFLEMTKHYHIKIPVSEIKIIHDYLYQKE